MPHYLQTFFERFGPEFAFLEYEDVMAEFWDRTLPPIIANCIAAMASRCVPIKLDICDPNPVQIQVFYSP